MLIAREKRKWSDAYVWLLSFRYCCSSSVIWSAWYTKTNRNKVYSLCFLICFSCLWLQESERGYTSLKAPARWESFSPPVACFKTSSVPWWPRRRRLRRRQWQWRHKTKNASSFTQLLRLTSISLLLSFCWPRVGFDVFALLSDGICSLSLMLVRGKLECVLYIVSNRNVGKRYASPILIQNFTLFQPNDNFPSLIFLDLNRFPLWRGCLLFTNDSFGCGWTFVFAVNRSEFVRLCWKRSVVFVYVCAQARGRVELCPCVTTNVGMLFVFSKLLKGHILCDSIALFFDASIKTGRFIFFFFVAIFCGWIFLVVLNSLFLNEITAVSLKQSNGYFSLVKRN